MAIWEEKEILHHCKRQVLIETHSKAQVGALIFDEASILVPGKYSNDSNVFSAEYIAELLKHIGVNDYTINLEEDK